MKNKILSAFTILSLAPTLLAADYFNVQERIEAKKYYRQTYKSIFGQSEFGLGSDFKKIIKSLEKDKKKQVLSFIKQVDQDFPANILRPLVYWRFIKRDSSKVAEVLSFHMYYKQLILRDYINFPTTSAIDKKKARSLIKEINHNEAASEQNIQSELLDDYKNKANHMAIISSDDAFVRAIKETKLVSLNIQERINGLPPYSLSYMGIIPGNQVEIISKNDRSKRRMDWINERVIFAGGVLDFDAPYIKMPTKRDTSGHIVFQQDPIFIKIKDMIDQAQESIFIDIFLFGGTLGATLSEYLIDETLKKRKKNPNFKVLFLHDYATNYNMKEEMMPVFRYIKSRINNEPEVAKSVMLMQANIQRHPPGIPFGITNLIPKTDEIFNVIEQKNTYYESKIDHSKVIVIDANTNQPQAYFGSKNWTDHSGSYYYDDAIWVKGPAAALVQASYYDDIEAALTTDKKEQKWFFFKDEGLDNMQYMAVRDKILDWFKIKKTNYPYIGKESIRIAEADVDGTVKNVRNILIDMIKTAKKNIYMEQLFLYDSYVVNALMKRKIEVPELDVKVMIDHNGNFGFNGLPNTLFMKEMIKYGIEVRTRKTGDAHVKFPDGTEKTYHQENHRKITSVDGISILGGSSNINPDTLQGSFREFGAQIWSKQEVSKFEARFLQSWKNNKETEILDIENFEVKIGEKKLSKRISALINGLGSFLYSNKDKLERRY